jgi:hypothetical protein
MGASLSDCCSLYAFEDLRGENPLITLVLEFINAN